MYKSIDGVVTYVHADGTIGSGARELRAYGCYDSDAVSHASALDTAGELSLTKQSFRDEADINEIVRRFGVLPPVRSDIPLPTYGDFTGVKDFRSALDAVMRAEDSFMQVPADIRAKFENDPQRFVAFCSDEANRGELQRMGLIPTQPVVAPKAPEAATPVSPVVP